MTNNETNQGNLYGYARVSSTDQSVDIQLEKLNQAGCTVVRSEKLSGASMRERTELNTILDFIQESDTLVVCKLDRLARSNQDLQNTLALLKEKGAHLRVLDQGIDTASPAGKFMFDIMAALAEMERSVIRERQSEGIIKAKANGVYKGRKRKVKIKEAKRLKGEGLTVTAIAKHFDASRQQVYEALKAA